MTTIVYHNNIIAYDSRQATKDGTITDDSMDKSYIREGVAFFISGWCSEVDDLIKAYFGEDYDKEIISRAMLEENGRVYLAGIDDKKFWKQEITGKPRAIGSGSDHAWTAIDMGCSAVEAVEKAMKRDCFTGGKVNSYLVKKS